MQRDNSTRVIVAALIGNLLIAITKFIAAGVTGSSAMLSEGIHSVVDTGNQVLLLYGLHRASRPPDERFPFGYGKEVYFWSFVVAILIFAVGAGVSFYEGVIHILEPSPVENVMVSYAVLGFSLLFEGAAWMFAIREFTRAKGKWGYIEAVQRGKNPSLFVALFEDSAAITGILIAFAGIGLGQWTGLDYFDGIASAMIGLILGGTAVWLAFETKGLLIGESANQEVVQGIRRLAAELPEVLRVNEVLTLHMGPSYILVNLSVKFSDDLPAATLESTIQGLDQRIKGMFPRVKRVFVEAESFRKSAPQSATADQSP